MSPVSSSSSQCYPPARSGGFVGWSAEKITVENAILETVPVGISADLVDLIVSFIPYKQVNVFADNDWNDLCGRVAPAPPLPLNIENIWEGPCPVFWDQKVKDTHVLVYLPTAVDGLPLTLNTLGEIAKQHYFPKTNAGYEYIWNEIARQMGDQPVDTACWVLMTKKIIVGSRGAWYKGQQTMIADLAKRAMAPYKVPTALQASICILTHYMRTRMRLFNDAPYTLTRCQESIDTYQLVVGGFSSVGLNVYNQNRLASDKVGVAVLRNFLDH